MNASSGFRYVMGLTNKFEKKNTFVEVINILKPDSSLNFQF